MASPTPFQETRQSEVCDLHPSAHHEQVLRLYVPMLDPAWPSAAFAAVRLGAAVEIIDALGGVQHVRDEFRSGDRRMPGRSRFAKPIHQRAVRYLHAYHQPL